jgi:hypothetical protein
LLVHECRATHGGCDFENFFLTTPVDLLQVGIYREIATPMHAHPRHLAVAMSLLARKMGASVDYSGGRSQGLSQTAAEAGAAEIALSPLAAVRQLLSGNESPTATLAEKTVIGAPLRALCRHTCALRKRLKLMGRSADRGKPACGATQDEPSDLSASSASDRL